MTTTTAPEVHKPALFVPENYEIVDYFDKHRPQPPFDGSEGAVALYNQIIAQWNAERTALFGERRKLSCDHCGQTNVMLVVAVDYIPTGERKCFGWQCAEEIGMPLDSYKRKRLERVRKANFARLDKEIKKDLFRKSNPEIVQFIETEAQRGACGEFLSSMKFIYDAEGALSEAQIRGVQKCIEGKKKFNAMKVEQAKKLENAPPAPEGRQTVEGAIISTKVIEGEYGTQIKMLVQLLDGNKVWCTVPSALDSVACGLAVRFTATFTRSTTDVHFAFAKRPKLH